MISLDPGVASAVATLHVDSDGIEQLAAYATLNVTGDAPTANELRASLAAKLPEFAVPDVVVLLEKMPLTPAGDIDRTLLPEPRRHTPDPTRSARAELVCELVAAVFGLPTVNPAENFFDLGGNSLLVSRLVTLLRSVVEAEISVRNVLAAETIGSLVERIDAGSARAPEMGNFSPSIGDNRQDSAWLVVPEERSCPRGTAQYLKGPLDQAALRQALTDLVGRHQVLQTLHRESDGTIHLVIREGAEALVDLPVIKASASGLSAYLDTEAVRRFDRRSELPLRAVLFALGPEDHVLLLAADRSACDEHSMRVLWRDLSHAYTARLSSYPPVWEILPVQFSGYLRWLEQFLAADCGGRSNAERQMEYWRQALKDLPEGLALPFDRPRPQRPSHRMGRVTLTLPDGLNLRLHSVARRYHATVRMVLQAGLAAFLARLGAGYDLPIGAASGGRPDARLNTVVGSLCNSLVLRVDAFGDPSFGELIGRVRKTALAADAHRELPFARIAAELGRESVSFGHPLYQVSIELATGPAEWLRLPGLSVAESQIGAGFELDLSVTFHESFDSPGSQGSLTGLLSYSADLFNHDTAGWIADGLVRLIEAAVAGPEQPISRLPHFRSGTVGERQIESHASVEE
ncbi:condensation domain-containing protein [Micromonospora sp. NPDC005172]|uniref:condensation domain-containing protein n=1 Tax=Micromonospora sp. NPDC005172 TaxID=3156867 RepID=UPI0033AB1340